MTPTRWKHLNLQETIRSNKAQEKLKEVSNRIATVKLVVDGVTGLLDAFLPFGLNFAKWKSASHGQVATALKALEEAKAEFGQLPDKEFALYKKLKAALGGIK